MNKIIIKEDVIPSIKLMNGVNNSLKVLTTWDKDKLVGLIRVVGDNYTIIYIQDILILKSYQGQGIGIQLLKLILERYKSIRQIVLQTDKTEKTINFYKKNGMVKTANYNGVCFVKYNFN